MELQAIQFLILTVSGWVTRKQQQRIAYLMEEVRVLRQKIPEKRLRFTVAQKKRLARAAKKVARKDLMNIASLVTPDTLQRWWRQLIAQKYVGSTKRGPGRPRTVEIIRELVVNMAKENPSWGYTRIRGALKNVGYGVSRSTIKRVMAESGIDPAPNRSRSMPWKTFLRAQWGVIAAADFFSVEALTLFGIVRYWVLFVMDLKTRQVEIAGIVNDNNLCGDWMKQVARNLTYPFDGYLLCTRYIILDRGSMFTKELREYLEKRGVETVRLPVKSPNL